MRFCAMHALLLSTRLWPRGQLPSSKICRWNCQLARCASTNTTNKRKETRARVHVIYLWQVRARQEREIRRDQLFPSVFEFLRDYTSSARFALFRKQEISRGNKLYIRRRLRSNFKTPTNPPCTDWSCNWGCLRVITLRIRESLSGWNLSTHFSSEKLPGYRMILYNRSNVERSLGDAFLLVCWFIRWRRHIS